MRAIEMHVDRLNVRDLLKSYKFISPKPSMDMEDLAVNIESFIEDMYRRRHGDEWGECQVQVYKVLDETGKIKYEFQDDVTSKFKDGDTVVMAVNAVCNTQQQRPCQASQLAQVLIS